MMATAVETKGWTRDQMALMAAENLIAGVTDKPLPNRVQA